MNNLKFRAWDKKIQILGTVSNIDFEYEEVTFYIDDEEELDTCQPLKDVEIMQSTGLFDKNGKEIYEGDVVTGVFLENHEVVWREIRGCWLIQPLRTIGFIDLAKFNRKLEVIGNIYEDKELLENE